MEEIGRRKKRKRRKMKSRRRWSRRRWSCCRGRWSRRIKVKIPKKANRDGYKLTLMFLSTLAPVGSLVDIN